MHEAEKAAGSEAAGHRPPRGPIHLLHIGKTGGTAVKHALRQVPRDQPYELILHPHQTRLVDIDGSEAVIFAVRDPISRFVSAFYSRRRRGQPRYLHEWNALEQQLFLAFAAPGDLAAALADPDAPRHRLAREAMTGIRHFLPQSHWLGSTGFLLSRRSSILQVLFQETLAADFASLRARLALPATLQLPEGDLEAHRNPSGLDRRLGAAGREALMAWYADDYPLLELCRSLRRELQRDDAARRSSQRIP